RRRGLRIIGCALFVLSVVIDSGALLLLPGNLLLVHFALRIVFVTFVLVAMVTELFSPGQITFDTVSSSLCVYLLIGVVGENVYAMMETVVPGSIVSTAHTRADAPPGLDVETVRIFRMRYFSFITLTSVGYGDLVPGTTSARMCAITEALIG